jgi:hypothetical protein
MTSETERAADENALQGEFGETWLQAVAAGVGLSHGKPDTLDLDKADVQLTLREDVPGSYFPTVKVQVKTTRSLSRINEDSFSYPLDVKTYNILRRTDHVVRRILAVFETPDGERVELLPRGTLLVGTGAWVSLEGEPDTSNTESVSVRLPVSNTIDRQGLDRMLRAYGVRRSTPVPTVNPWERP